MHWTEIEVTPEASGRPWFTLSGSTADVVARARDHRPPPLDVARRRLRDRVRGRRGGGRGLAVTRDARRMDRAARGAHRRRRDHGERASPAQAHRRRGDRGRQGRRLRPRRRARRGAPRSRAGRRGSASPTSARRSPCAAAGITRPDPRVAARARGLVRGGGVARHRARHLDLRPAAAGRGRGIRGSPRRRAPQARDGPRPQRHRPRRLARRASPRRRGSSASASCGWSACSATSPTPPPTTIARRCAEFEEGVAARGIRRARPAAAAPRGDARGDRAARGAPRVRAHRHRHVRPLAVRRPHVGRPRPASGDDAARRRSRRCGACPPATGVSYGYDYRTDRETTLALVPLGYADGVPRQASGRGPGRRSAARRFTVAGRIAMDQFVVDVGDHPVAVGDEVVLFGDPTLGAPAADDWAEAARHDQLRDRHAHRPPRAAAAGVGVSGLDPLVGRHVIADARRHGGASASGSGGCCAPATSSC